VPAFLAPLVGFSLGAFFARWSFATAEREEEDAFYARLAIVGLFALFVFVPVCAYFLVFAGDWAYAYLVDSRTVPSALTLVLAVVDGLLVPAGFAAAYRAKLGRIEGLPLALMAVPAGLVLVSVAVLFHRFSVDGTFFQVNSRFGTRSLIASPLGVAVGWMLTMLAVGSVVTVRSLSLRGKLAVTAAAGSADQGRETPAGEEAMDTPDARGPLLGRRVR
jgi:hypothetical protein